MKKVLKGLVLMLVLALTLTGCGEKKAANLNMSVSEVIKKVYEGISSDEMPMVTDIEITKDTAVYFLGTDKVDFKEAVASEPMMGSIAYSVVAVKLNDGVNVEEAKKLIKDNVDTRKWICVEAENLSVQSNGDTILLIMMGNDHKDLVPKLEKNFKNLK